ncbi:I78 family peptidase inhibitor [Bordetella tumulicola]|uniref:I78 family peptidase inhibitor n=1 Tax=Bordetella tumulicola TaxID=1649133 RepID=UPI0039EFCE20
MIRKLTPIILAAILTACASPGTQQAPADTTTSGGGSMSSGSTQPGTCDAQAVQNLVGQQYTESLDSDIQSGAGANQIRVLKPGQVMTMEYNPARVNVIIEDNGAISAIRCG